MNQKEVPHGAPTPRFRMKEAVAELESSDLDPGRDLDFVAKLLDESDALEFRNAERILDALERQGRTVAGYPRVRPADCAHFLSAMRLVFESCRRSFITADPRIVRRFEEQHAKLDQALRNLLPDAMRFFQKLEGLKPRERERELGAFRPKARAELGAALNEILNEGQRTRLRQLELQREGLFGSGEIWKELHVTDAQRQQFVAAITETWQKIEPLMEEAQKGGNPEEIRPKVLKLRAELQRKLEALLTDAQKKQWQEMLGKPMDLGALFDLSSRY